MFKEKLGSIVDSGLMRYLYRDSSDVYIYIIILKYSSHWGEICFVGGAS